MWVQVAMNMNYFWAEKRYRAWLQRNGRPMFRFRVQALDALVALGRSPSFSLEDFLRVWNSAIASRPTAYRVLNEFVESGILRCEKQASGNAGGWMWTFSRSGADEG